MKNIPYFLPVVYVEQFAETNIVEITQLRISGALLGIFPSRANNAYKIFMPKRHHCDDNYY